MAAIILIGILIVLVLALTIGFVPFFVGSLYVVGWFLVAIIVVVLCWMLLQSIFRPFANWTSRWTGVGRLRSRIEKRRSLGYDTTEREAQLLKLQPTETLSESEANRRRQLGYTDKSNEA